MPGRTNPRPESLNCKPRSQHGTAIPDRAIEALMSSAAPLLTHASDHASAEAPADSASHVRPQAVADDVTAQTDRPDPKPCVEPTETDDSHSPLWPVAIGTACLFAAMAAVIAFS
jgi:hypothetical protein